VRLSTFFLYYPSWHLGIESLTHVWNPNQMPFWVSNSIWLPCKSNFSSEHPPVLGWQSLEGCGSSWLELASLSQSPVTGPWSVFLWWGLSIWHLRSSFLELSYRSPQLPSSAWAYLVPAHCSNTGHLFTWLFICILKWITQRSRADKKTSFFWCGKRKRQRSMFLKQAVLPLHRMRVTEITSLAKDSLFSRWQIMHGETRVSSLPPWG
jgi:hypothetical protein